MNDNHLKTISNYVDYDDNPIALIYLFTVAVNWADAIQFFEKVAQKNKFKRQVFLTCRSFISTIHINVIKQILGFEASENSAEPAGGEIQDSLRRTNKGYIAKGCHG